VVELLLENGADPHIGLRHGRPQTFFQGQGRVKTYYMTKRHLKRCYFRQKSAKNILFWSSRGVKGPLLPSPADAHGLRDSSSKPKDVADISQFHRFETRDEIPLAVNKHIRNAKKSKLQE